MFNNLICELDLTNFVDEPEITIHVSTEEIPGIPNSGW
jgi:hypothetical protein